MLGSGIDWQVWLEGLHAACAEAQARAADRVRRLERARAFIDAHCHLPLDLDDIARRAYFSRYHFLRQFKRAYDLTPHQYLTQQRMERAKRLLAAGELSVTEVCFEVGFESLGSFSTLFRRMVGQSPQRYRRRLVQCPGLPVHPALAFIPSCFLAVLGPH